MGQEQEQKREWKMGKGKGICSKSCMGRNKITACTDLVHKHLTGMTWGPANSDIVHNNGL